MRAISMTHSRGRVASVVIRSDPWRERSTIWLGGDEEALLPHHSPGRMITCTGDSRTRATSVSQGRSQQPFAGLHAEFLRRSCPSVFPARPRRSQGLTGNVAARPLPVRPGRGRRFPLCARRFPCGSRSHRRLIRARGPRNQGAARAQGGASSASFLTQDGDCRADSTGSQTAICFGVAGRTTVTR
jgi:hypothetical protein